MIETLEVFNPRVTTPPLPIGSGSASTDALQIRGIEGLGPVKADIATVTLSALDGENITNAAVGKRNIVLSIGLNPNWESQTIEGLRQILYRHFMPRSIVRLRFGSTHLPNVEIRGQVESLEPNIFAKNAEYQVSIICPDPYFVKTSPTVVTGLTSFTGSTGGIDIEYEGNVSVGFLLYIEKGSGGDVSGMVTVSNKTPAERIFILNSVVIDADEYVDLSTVDGSKYARKAFIPAGPPQSLMNQVAPSSSWLRLEPGENKIHVTTPVPGNAWTLRYSARYGGL